MDKRIAREVEIVDTLAGEKVSCPWAEPGATSRIGMLGLSARSVRPTLPKSPATSRGPSERLASIASVA
jgi:hypothetical protein